MKLCPGAAIETTVPKYKIGQAKRVQDEGGAANRPLFGIHWQENL